MDRLADGLISFAVLELIQIGLLRRIVVGSNEHTIVLVMSHVLAMAVDVLQFIQVSSSNLKGRGGFGESAGLAPRDAKARAFLRTFEQLA